MSTSARVNVAPSIWQWLLTIGAELPSRDMEKVAEWRSPNAEKTPTINQLKELSGRLHVPFGYFLLRAPIDDTPPIFAFRTVKGKGVEHPSRELIDTVAQMSQIQEWARDDAERNRLEELSFIGSANIKSPVETVVSNIRKTLGIESDWFKDDTIQGTRVSKNSAIKPPSHSCANGALGRVFSSSLLALQGKARIGNLNLMSFAPSP